MIHFLRVKPGFNQTCYGKPSSPGEERCYSAQTLFIISAQTEELLLTTHQIQQNHKVTNNFDCIIYQSPGVWIVGAGGGTVAQV